MWIKGITALFGKKKKPKKIRFVNEALLVQNLPVMLCPPPQTEGELDKFIDSFEEILILEKAEEIKKKRALLKPKRIVGRRVVDSD